MEYKTFYQEHILHGIFFMQTAFTQNYMFAIASLFQEHSFACCKKKTFNTIISNNVHHFVFLCPSVASIVILVTNSQFLFHSFSLQKSGTDAK